jgi:hypothetical protein
MRYVPRLSGRRCALYGTLFATLGAVCLVPWQISARQPDDLPRKLPADGTWVRYGCIVKSDDGSVNESLTTTISVVGRKAENGVPCLWVEFKFGGVKFERGDAGENAQWLFKCLIPEKALLEEERPLQQVVRAWEKLGDNDVEELSPAALRGEYDADRFVSLDEYLLFCPGVLRRTERLAKQQAVDFQKGRLVIPDGRRGKSVVRSPGSNPTAKLSQTTEYELWFHRDLPVGFAFARLRITSDDENSPFPAQTHEYTAQDAGTDAKTLLPDSN